MWQTINQLVTLALVVTSGYLFVRRLVYGSPMPAHHQASRRRSVSLRVTPQPWWTRLAQDWPLTRKPTHRDWRPITTRPVPAISLPVPPLVLPVPDLVPVEPMEPLPVDYVESSQTAPAENVPVERGTPATEQTEHLEQVVYVMIKAAVDAGFSGNHIADRIKLQRQQVYATIKHIKEAEEAEETTKGVS